ncbi:MAG: amino acid ABC transporter permease [Coriobacteriia bacterium]|nr:amino acid ABC transporter permease [Coriobacteriia bacterium]
MNPKLRRTIWYAVNAIMWVILAVLLLTMVGPERFLYEAPAKRGQTGMVDKIYIVSPTKDVLTIGKRGNVLLPHAVMDNDFGITLERQPAGSAAKDSSWTVHAEETSPTPVLLNGDRLTGSPVVADGDIITIGGVDVLFDGSRRGVLGALDWWESARVSHLFASPSVIAEAFPILLMAFPVSLFAVIISYLLAIPGGLALAFMKMAKTRWARLPATAYVDVVRGTPIFLQILLVFFGLPLLPPWQVLMGVLPQLRDTGLFGIENSLYLRAFVVLSFNSAAYMAEIFRAGIQSISKGQMEAARSLGMTTPQAMAYVIIPQTIRRILPTMMSEFILLFKDTSLFSAVGLSEIVMRAREVASSTLNVSPYLLAAVFYLVITVPLGRFVQQLENRLAKAEGGGGAVPPEKPAGETSVDSAAGDPLPTRAERM